MPGLIEFNAREGDNRGHPAAPRPALQPIRNSDSSDKEKKAKKIKIYIDHPNFWIGGQGPTGNRYWPYDAAGLRSLLVEHTQLWKTRQQYDVTVEIYGSSLWPFRKTWTNLGARVNQFVRSRSNREKEVDTSLVADSVAEAVSDHFRGIETEFVIVSGDRDMLPAVKKIKDFGFRVHVWSWERSVTTVYKDLYGSNVWPSFTLHRLDDFMGRFVQSQP